MHGINHPKVEIHVMIRRKSHHTLLDTACFEQSATSFAGSTELYRIIPDIFSKTPMLQIDANCPLVAGKCFLLWTFQAKRHDLPIFGQWGALLRFFEKTMASQQSTSTPQKPRKGAKKVNKYDHDPPGSTTIHHDPP